MKRSAHRIAIIISLGLALLASTLIAQDPVKPTLSPTVRLGERLTYNISFQRYDNVGYAETYAVSRGKLGESDAVELRLKFKTTGLLSAAFYQIDESRTTFASPDSGMPLLVRRRDNSGVEVKETVNNYLTSPASGLDILTLIYKARQTSGAGSFILFEKDRSYSVTFQPQGNEKVKTDAGEFDTSVSVVQSDFLSEAGILNLRVNFSTDDAHVPVAVRFKTAKGDCRISLSSIQIAESEPEATPTPTAGLGPVPTPTPRSIPTPTPYIDNEPLAPELGFQLGESLTFRISNGGRVLADIQLQAKERKKFSGEDALLLAATVTSAEKGNGVFNVGDSMRVQVNTETLAPRELNVRLSGPLAFLNGTAQFDQKTGIITQAGSNRIDAPIGTHAVLSLLYAIRSFNLKPSKVPSNPVNDTRVAVFWQGRAYIFTLRPSEPGLIEFQGQKIAAQQISVNTGVAELDRAGIKIWLSNDERRLPLRLSFGSYQADLIADSKIQPK